MAAPYSPALGDRAQKAGFAALFAAAKVQQCQTMLHPMLRGK
jgi:hypothetical protein